MTGVRLQFKIYGSAHAILDSAELYNAAFNYSALIRLQHLPERSVGKRGADVAQRADVAHCAGFACGADVSPCADFARPAQVPPADAAISGAFRERLGGFWKRLCAALCDQRRRGRCCRWEETAQFWENRGAVTGDDLRAALKDGGRPN